LTINVQTEEKPPERIGIIKGEFKEDKVSLIDKQEIIEMLKTLEQFKWRMLRLIK
jgi:hypothetical protein